MPLDLFLFWQIEEENIANDFIIRDFVAECEGVC